MAHLYVNGKLNGWFSSKKQAEDCAREYRSEGKKAKVTDGTLYEAYDVWNDERSAAARKGWETRRRKAVA